MPNPVYETMTRRKTAYFTVRVWREVVWPEAGPDWRVEAALDALQDESYINTILHTVGAIERVSAVEVLDENGNGALFYPDWK
jgi:hypothetical protein